MKKIILLLSFLLIAVIKMTAQLYQTQNIYGVKWLRAKFDSTATMPSIHDTIGFKTHTNLADASGSMFYVKADSSLYVWTGYTLQKVGNVSSNPVIGSPYKIPYFSAVNSLTGSPSLGTTSDGWNMYIGNIGATNMPTGVRLVVGDTISSSPRGLMSWQSNTGTDGARFHLRKSRGTFSSPTVIQNKDILGRIVSSGYNGTSFTETANIEFKADSSVISGSIIPSKIGLYTTDYSGNTLEGLGLSTEHAVVLPKFTGGMVTPLGYTGYMSMWAGSDGKINFRDEKTSALNKFGFQSGQDQTYVFRNTSGNTVDTVAFRNVNNNFDSSQTFSTNGAASTPSIILTGTPYIGGGTTTNYPLFYINNNTGAATADWNGSGTYIGIKPMSAGFSGNYLDFKNYNSTVSAFKVSSNGDVISNNNIDALGRISIGSLSNPSSLYMIGGGSGFGTFGTSGVGIRQDAGNYISTSTTGTVAQVGINTLGQPTLVQSNIGTITSGGTGYNGGGSGTFTSVAMSSGTGSGKIATITVSSGIITGVIITTGGSGFLQNDVLTVTSAAMVSAGASSGGSGLQYTLGTAPTTISPTLTTVSTLFISNAPLVQNMNNSAVYSIHVGSGVSAFDGGIVTNSTGQTSSNMYVAGGTSIISSSSIPFSGFNTNARTIFNGNSQSSLTAGYNYGNVVISHGSLATSSTSGVHDLIANLVVDTVGAIAINSGTITKNASLYISGQKNQLTSGQAWSFITASGKTLHGGSPTASANYGTVNIGGGAFDGSTTGYFAGYANGTSLAINEIGSFTGNIIDCGLGNGASSSYSSKFRVDYSGNTILMGRLAVGINSAGGASLLVSGNIGSTSSFGTAAGSTSIGALGIGSATYTSSTSSGTIATAGVNTIGVPILAANSTTILTNASTLYIAGAPTVTGVNMTITNPYALYVNSGDSYFGGAMSTGTSSYSNGSFYTNSSIQTGISTSNYLFGGASSVSCRTVFSGSVNGIGVSNSSASVLLASAAIQAGASGTNIWAANLAIKPIGTITAGANPITNTASLYVDGAYAGSNSTNNYALYVNSGASYFGGTGQFSFANTSIKFDQFNSGTAIIKENGNNSLSIQAYAILFKTNTAADRMQLSSNGNLIIQPTGGTFTDNGSTLQVNGSISKSYAARGTNVTLGASDYFVNLTSPGLTASLPSAIGITGREYVIKLTAAGTATIDVGATGQRIDGATTYSLSAQNKYIKVASDGANWMVVGNN